MQASHGLVGDFGQVLISPSLGGLTGKGDNRTSLTDIRGLGGP